MKIYPIFHESDWLKKRVWLRSRRKKNNNPSLGNSHEYSYSNQKPGSPFRASRFSFPFQFNNAVYL